MDASTWKTVYHSKQTQQQSGTLTKRYERISSNQDKPTHQPHSFNIAEKRSESACQTDSSGHVVGVATCPDLPRHFYESLIEECESKFEKGDGKGVERIIKIELTDAQPVSGEPRKSVEESYRRSGEENNVRRYVYTVSTPQFQEKGSGNDISRSERTIERNDEKPTIKIHPENKLTDTGSAGKLKKEHHVQWGDKKQQDSENRNYSSENGSESPICTRNTYKDWVLFKEKLLKEFEDVKPCQTQRLHANELKNNSNYHQDDSILSPPKLRCKLKKRVVAAGEDWQLRRQYSIDSSVDKCKQQERQMTGNLREIHEIVDDVKKLSQKFPNLFQVEREREVVSPITISTAVKEIPNDTRPEGVVYMAGIRFPVNEHGYKTTKVTSL